MNRLAYLEEIPKLKRKLIHLLAENEAIVKYIDNIGSDIFDGSDLIGKNIFPFHYVPDTQTEVKVYICFNVFAPNVKDKLLKDVHILINVFSHKDKGMYEDDSRVDLINIEIDHALNGKQGFGIDSVELMSALPYSPGVNDYCGIQLIYKVLKLNQKGCDHN